MIVVEIPAALAHRPEVVPVDMSLHTFDLRQVAALHMRVALAWRETCPCLHGQVVDGYVAGFPVLAAHADRDGTGSRMVVGWTAEVEAVGRVLTLSEDPSPGVDRWVLHVAPTWADQEHVYLWRVGAHTATGDRYWSVDQTPLGRRDDPTWSTGRYALVLRDVQTFGDIVHGELVSPMRGRPFSGFAELDDAL